MAVKGKRHVSLESNHFWDTTLQRFKEWLILLTTTVFALKNYIQHAPLTSFTYWQLQHLQAFTEPLLPARRQRCRVSGPGQQKVRLSAPTISSSSNSKRSAS